MIALNILINIGPYNVLKITGDMLCRFSLSLALVHSVSF